MHVGSSYACVNSKIPKTQYIPLSERVEAKKNKQKSKESYGTGFDFEGSTTDYFVVFRFFNQKPAICPLRSSSNQLNCVPRRLSNMSTSNSSNNGSPIATEHPQNIINTVCCSAPGKVLLTGGYMILERPNSGLVLTVNARFCTVIQQLSPSSKHNTTNNNNRIINVHSPQFNHSESYLLEVSDGTFSLSPQYVLIIVDKWKFYKRVDCYNIYRYIFFVLLSSSY